MTLKEKKLDLMNQRKTAIDAAKEELEANGVSEAYTAKKAKVDNLTAQIEEVDALIAAEEKSFGGEDGGQDGQLRGMMGQDGGPTGYEKAVKDFAAAARNGFRVSKDEDGPMQEGEGSKGGYTVPEDIVTRIIELRDSEESLLSEVTVENVTTSSGRRTHKKRSQHTGFATVAEMGKYGKTATPKFETVSYKVEKRGGVLPVTQELYDDSDNNIAAIAQDWLAQEARVTANREILEVVKSKDTTDLKNLDGILAAWVGLGSAFRPVSKLITNDDGLLYLGTLKDENGRYLLTPNPAEPHQLQLAIGPYALPVKTYDNDTIPSDGTKIPMILGSLKDGVVYWDRKSFSVAVSDTAVVGDLNAFEQDLILWKGSLRDDCTSWDDEAFVNGYIDRAAAGAED